MGKEVSRWVSLNREMPQGSWLGPLCFIVHVQNLPMFKNIAIHKYIDDTTLTQPITKNINNSMQQSINKVVSWSSNNFMKINETKTKEMVIDMKRKALNLKPIEINETPIERVQCFKILGIWVQDNLMWDTHIEKMTAKASQRLYFLRLLKRSGLDSENLLIYYKAVIRSILEYGAQAWHSGLSKEHVKIINKI